MRFWLMKEFEGFDYHNFLNNLKWFDIKLLAMQQGQIMITISKAVANDTYAKAIKDVLGKLGLASSHWVHLGRALGPKPRLLNLQSEMSAGSEMVTKWMKKRSEKRWQSMQ
jgi:hypothetical protein